MTTYLVTLKTLRSLRALRADNPKLPARSWKLTQKTSKTEPVMTIVSKRLNELKNSKTITVNGFAFFELLSSSHMP